MAKVIVACGTGIATSTHVVDKLERVLKGEKLKIQISQCRVSEIRSLVQPGDVVVSTAQVASDGTYTVLNGVPFLTGIGEQELVKQFLEAVRKILQG